MYVGSFFLRQHFNCACHFLMKSREDRKHTLLKENWLLYIILIFLLKNNVYPWAQNNFLGGNWNFSSVNCSSAFMIAAIMFLESLIVLICICFCSRLSGSQEDEIGEAEIEAELRNEKKAERRAEIKAELRDRSCMGRITTLLDHNWIRPQGTSLFERPMICKGLRLKDKRLDEYQIYWKVQNMSPIFNPIHISAFRHTLILVYLISSFIGIFQIMQ